MNSNELSPFSWGEISLSQVINQSGVPHVTRRAIGEWLGYSEPKHAISKILKRNPYIESYAVVVNLTTTDGKNYDTRVYHPIGFMLIVMESGQPKAKEFKEAVANFVWSFSRPSPLKLKERLDLHKLKRGFIRDLTKAKDAYERQALGNSLREICQFLGETMPEVCLLGKDADQYQLEL
ncbi:MAG: hypothetical protein HQL54_13325 [Magnetococcales bacterium]|nr:hypothetical protein [Magnetococcales bacterium]